jgi:hypothetical protein
MKGLTFSNFTVGENNRAAYDACQKVASLQSDPGKPVTLVGGKGAGKSHLLWAIVNECREDQAPDAVTLISADDFPRKIQEIANDPTPIMKSCPAVLLVDEMEQFKENLAELEAVVRVFLENGHAVVLASRVHPGALSEYSGKFKELLSSGTILGMQAAGVASGDGTVKLEAEHDHISAALERSEGALFETRRELVSAREAADKARAKLDLAAGLVKALADRLAEVETLQHARLEALDQALAGLNQDLDLLAGDCHAGDDSAMAAYDSMVAEKRAAEAQLDKARRENAQSMARTSVSAGEVQRLLDRAAALLLTADEGPAVAEARKHVSDAILRLVRIFGGASGAKPDETGGGTGASVPRRAMPGGDALAEVVKKAFGDPVDDGDDGEDFTYAEPAPEEDEPGTGLDRP